ncbi:MAG: hypothetical protein Q4C34_01650 [Bacteroidales bacterium]|nr:hypothetical protein [Bacteroidales bacterium]
MRRLVYIIVMAVAAACSTSSSSETAVSEAVDAMEHGDRDRAQACVDAVMADSAGFASLDARQLCTLARVLVQLTADTDNESNDASAARCLARARSLAPDSVTAFLYSLPGEDAGRLMVLDRVGSYLEMPRDSLVSAEDLAGEQTDSIQNHFDE